MLNFFCASVQNQVWCFLFPLKIQSSTWLPILSRLVGCIHIALSFSDLTNPISSTSQLCSVLYQSIGACDMPYRLPNSLKIRRGAPLYASVQRTGVDKNMGLGGRPPYHLKSAQRRGRHHLKWPFSFFLFIGLVGYLHPINRQSNKRYGGLAPNLI